VKHLSLFYRSTFQSFALFNSSLLIALLIEFGDVDTAAPTIRTKKRNDGASDVIDYVS